MTPAVSVLNLRKTYKGGVEALKGVSLEVAEGDFFALLGPNGAGKTTIIGILSGLTVKTSGEAAVFGAYLAHYLQDYYWLPWRWLNMVDMGL